jgi:hypothetical protein
MTTGDRRHDKKKELLQFAAGKHALRAADAAGHMCLPVAAATPQERESRASRRKHVLLPCGAFPRERLPLLRWAAAWLAAVLSILVAVAHVAAVSGLPSSSDESGAST